MRAATLPKPWRRPKSIPPNGSLTPFLFQTRTILDQRVADPKPKSKSNNGLKDAYAASRLARYGIGVMRELGVEPPLLPPRPLPSRRSTMKVTKPKVKSKDPAKAGTLEKEPGTKLSKPSPRRALATFGDVWEGPGTRSAEQSVGTENRIKTSVHNDDIPFQGTSGQSERPIKSTITKAEKEAFARLFNLVITPDGTYKPRPASTRVAITDEDYPEHFPEPLKRMAARASRKVQEKEEEARLSRELEAQAADRVARDKAEAERLASDPLHQQQVAQKDRIEALLDTANTDVELWNVLESELFSPIQLLHLDDPNIASKNRAVVVDGPRKSSSTLAAEAGIKPDDEQKDLVPSDGISSSRAMKLRDSPGDKVDPSSDLATEKKRRQEVRMKHTAERTSQRSTLEHNIAVITYIYPIILRTALDHLTRSFPASPLPFSILPRIKRLGRTSYILGASTSLYNEIIYLTWKVYADFHRIDELLQEFDPAGLEFDHRTLEILENIAREGEKARRGRLGLNIKTVWSMDVFASGWQKVVEWIPAVSERLEQEALREAEEKARKREEIYEEKDVD